jgi:uncharacterized protein (DUF427 family)
MSLTVGTGPFGPSAAGAFNFEVPRAKGVIYFEDFPRRMRALLNGETIVDSRHAKLLHEQGHLPVLYFPADEIRLDLLEPTDHATHCPYKGDASYWSVRAGDRVAENAVWSYPDPLPDAPPLAGHYAVYWRQMDEWLEEDEPAIVHVRDPYHRVDVLETSRHVVVSLGDDVLAESRAPLVVYETGLPPRWYFAPEEVRTDLLVASETRTGCAYKGFASYWSLPTPDPEDGQDLVWTYREPRSDVGRIRDRLAFFDERVDIVVDGEAQERPRTQWSPRSRAAHGA